MRYWRYSVSTNTLWASFDFGTVSAETLNEARNKAIEKLTYDFSKVNDALSHCDNTQGFTIDFNKDSVELEEVSAEEFAQHSK